MTRGAWSAILLVLPFRGLSHALAAFCDFVLLAMPREAERAPRSENLWPSRICGGLSAILPQMGGIHSSRLPAHLSHPATAFCPESAWRSSPIQGGARIGKEPQQTEFVRDNGDSVRQT